MSAGHIPEPPRPATPARRRSIFPGLLLLALGVFFLAGNFRPEWQLWSLFFTWWPLILILWGLARLFDVWAARSSGQPAPRTLSGGEFVLLLFVIAIGLAVGGAMRLSDRVDFLPPWAEPFEFTEEIARAGIPEGSTIAIHIRRGNVTVVEGQSDELRIRVTRQVDGLSEEDARRRAEEELSLELVESARTYELRLAPHSRAHPRVAVGMHRGSRTDLTVHLPRGTSLRVGPLAGNVSVEGLAGSLYLEGHRGRAEIRNLRGDAEIEKRSGETRLEAIRGSVRLTGSGGAIEAASIAGGLHIEGSFSGPVRVRGVAGSTRYLSNRTDLTVGSVPGRLELSRGRLQLVDAAGDLALSARDYDMLLENISGAIQVENRQAGDIELRFSAPPRHSIQVRADKGHIDLVMPGDAPFSIAATTRNGRISTDFPGLSPAQDDRRSELAGQVGRGGPLVRLDATIGDIRIRAGR